MTSRQRAGEREPLSGSRPASLAPAHGDAGAPTAPADGAVAPDSPRAASELESKGHALIARGHRLLARAAGLRARPASGDPIDVLVPISDVPLDARTRLRLERDGRLPVMKIGRRKFTRRSALAELVPPRGAASPPRPPPARVDARSAATQAYIELVAGSSKRSRLPSS
jgi:hypothetical protein